ncbi:MAG: hypothetical protein GWP75_11185 [Planctomycetia bacterium]|nr:hypothetical protein [Planctomycetia bacterium]
MRRLPRHRTGFSLAMIATGLLTSSLHADLLLLLQQESESDDAMVGGAPPIEVDEQGISLEYKPSGGYVHEFGADFSGGGSVSVDRGFAAFKVGIDPGGDFNGSIGVAWGGDWYRFDGTSDLSPAPGVAPWSDIQAMAILGSMSWQIDREWSTTVGLNLRFAGERDADAGDSMTVGGFGAISYAFSRTFSLGAGAILSSQIEDSILVIPALVIYWQATDTIIVSNVLGPEVYPTGAGIEVAWRPDRVREVAIGSRYESRRFRLDDSGPASRRNGVGEDTGYPLWARATWRFESGLRLDVVGGVSLFNSYRLDDANGNEIAKTDLDPAPFIGIFGSWTF